MDFFEMLKVIFLGIVEGITEWLPISSTGHMLLVDEFVQLNMTEEFKEMFFILIQLGAILAVILLFWGKMCLAKIPYFQDTLPCEQLFNMVLAKERKTEIDSWGLEKFSLEGCRMYSFTSLCLKYQ